MAKPADASASKSSDRSPASEIDSPGPADVGNIDKIRDILFGNQVRDFDRRFSRFEEHLAEVTAQLRSDVLKRIDALEAYCKAELHAAKDQLRDAVAQRLDVEQQLAERIKGVESVFDTKLRAADDRTAERVTELRQQILEQSKQLSEELQAKYERSAKAIATAAGHLEEAKLDRSTFSECLMDLAMRISSTQAIDLSSIEQESSKQT